VGPRTGLDAVSLYRLSYPVVTILTTCTHARERQATKLAHRLQLSGYCGRDDLTGIEALSSSTETAAGQHSGNTSVRKSESYLFHNSYEGIRGFPNTGGHANAATLPLNMLRPLPSQCLPLHPHSMLTTLGYRYIL
jgi:hypothetical protein